MENNSRIIIRRSSQWKDKHYVYKFFVDGAEVGVIGSATPLYFIVTPGIHKFQCKCKQYASAELELTIKPDETVYLKTKNLFGSILPIYLLAIIIFILIKMYQKKLGQQSAQSFWIAAYSFFIGAALLRFFFRKKSLTLKMERRETVL